MTDPTPEPMPELTEEMMEQIQALPQELQGLPDDILQQISAYRKLEAMMRIGFDPDKNYYLAGPMTGYPEYNYPAFTQVASMLRDYGLQIESPHEIPWPKDHEKMSTEALWTKMMKLSAKIMQKCDGIILMQGWPASRGARKELEVALSRDWDVWFISSDGIIVNMSTVKSNDKEEESNEADPVGE